MATKTKTRNINQVLELTKIERFERVNIHIPGKDHVNVDGVDYFGTKQYFGVVWFSSDNGQTFVSFVKKTTKLWQEVRVAKIGTKYNVAANIKEDRSEDDHVGINRTVLTHVRLS